MDGYDYTHDSFINAIGQLEKENGSLKTQLKIRWEAYSLLVKENKKLREQVFGIDRNNMILSIHQWHNMNNELTKLQIENNKLKRRIDKIDENENIRPVKGKSIERIDGIVALINAMARLVVHIEKKSIYNERGVIVL